MGQQPKFQVLVLRSCDWHHAPRAFRPGLKAPPSAIRFFRTSQNAAPFIHIVSAIYTTVFVQLKRHKTPPKRGQWASMPASQGPRAERSGCANSKKHYCNPALKEMGCKCKYSHPTDISLLLACWHHLAARTGSVNSDPPTTTTPTHTHIHTRHIFKYPR